MEKTYLSYSVVISTIVARKWEENSSNLELIIFTYSNDDILIISNRNKRQSFVYIHHKNVTLTFIFSIV
jgi:hypothetical protein